MRGQGRVFRPKYGGIESRVWWLDYSVRGKRYRESSETTNKTAAQRLLRERIGNREAGKLVGRPDRVKLAEDERGEDGKDRQEGEFAALLLESTADVRDLVQFLRATGWRRDEGRLLTWAAVDMGGGTIRLEDARSKSGKPRVFPFGLAPSLKALLEKRRAQRD